jgi:hypothetical protein
VFWHHSRLFYFLFKQATPAYCKSFMICQKIFFAAQKAGVFKKELEKEQSLGGSFIM